VTKKVAVILSDNEYAQVRKSAGEVPLSTWIRNRIIEWKPASNLPADVFAAGMATAMQRLEDSDAEDNPAQDLPRVGNVPAPERRAGVAKSVSASRATRKKEREIKLCRHNLAECTICGVSA